MSWWNTNWTYRKKLTFANNAYEAFTDFPVLIHLKDGGGAGRIDVDFAGIKAAGADIRFVDDDDSTELKYEIESWDDVAEEAWIWVKVPTLAQSDTDFIYMYWGNPAAADDQDAPNVWDANFIAVYHLHDDFLDSSGNGNHAANAGTDDIVAKIADGQDFIRANRDYISVPTGVTNHARLTLEMFVKPDNPALAAWQEFAAKVDATAIVRDWFLRPRKDTGFLQGNVWVGGVSHGAVHNVILSTVDFTYIGLTYDEETLYLYRDGAQVAVNATPAGPLDYHAASGISLGRLGSANGEYIDFVGDEVRFSNVARSANWVAAQNDSMTDSYITPGGKECQKIFTETINLTDSFSRIWTIYRIFTENLNLADTVAKKISRTFSEAIGLTDSVKKKIGKVFTENISLTDTFSRVWHIYRTFTENISLTDTISKKISKIFTETLHLQDAFSRIWTIYRTFTEKIALTDKVKAAKVNLVNLIKKLIQLMDIRRW